MTAPRVLVVADDLTGANATGARYARRGLTAVTVRDVTAADHLDEDCDVLVVDTSSRHLDAAASARRVQEVVTAFPAVDLVVKRVDTTLRGNVGAETAAALAAVAARTDQPVRALMVPAFPASGRTTVGGIQLMHGVPLAESEAGRDPLTPVPGSRVASILATQTDLRVSELPIDVVSGPAAELRQALVAGEAVVVADAVNEQHLRTLARAAAEVAEEARIRWVSVDPGPFGAELAGALGIVPEGQEHSDPLLAVVGSTTAITRAQIDQLRHAHLVEIVEIDPQQPVPAEVVDALERACASAEVVVLRPATKAGGPGRLNAEAARRIPPLLGGVVRELVKRRAVGGCYLTGGDTTDGVLEALDVRGLLVEGEILPLAVAGRLIGGPQDGLPVVTKGGLIGGEDAAIACIDHLRARAATGRPSGRAQM